MTCGHLQASIPLAARKRPTREVSSLEVGGVPGLGSWPHKLLPGRCLPCSDMALKLLSVLTQRDGEEEGEPSRLLL